MMREKDMDLGEQEEQEDDGGEEGGEETVWQPIFSSFFVDDGWWKWDFKKQWRFIWLIIYKRSDGQI